MPRLTAATLPGIWAGVTMSWNDDFSFDERSYIANIDRMVRARVHGIYTTGSTGEFYAIEFDDFKRMVDIQADLCGRAAMPLQIGCCADATRKTLRMLEYASSKAAVGAAQVTLPYWMELTDREMLQFFKDLHAACPDLPLVHYNIPRAKHFLHAADYLRILDVAPNLIGVKYTFAGTHFGALQTDMQRTPMLNYYVAENLLVSAMQLGAKGCCSSLIATNPKFMLDLYAKARAGKWDEAVQMQQFANTFFNDVEAFVESLGEGSIDPVGDKGLAIASGCFVGSPRCRAPYIGWSDAAVVTVRRWLEERYPMFLYSE
jgi:dihydrodipicolinate synthase/N-acetylneuraminate lyase